MDAANPYAPPQAPLADGDVAVSEPPELPDWRLEGDTLIARNGGTLPDICLYTGAPTTPEQRLTLALSWTPGWFRMMAVIAPMLAVFAYGVFRKASSVEVGFGPAGRKRRRLTALLSLGAALTAIAFVVIATGARDDGQEKMIFLFVSFLGLFAAAMLSRVFRVVRIDRRTTHLALRRPVVDAFARLPPPR